MTSAAANDRSPLELARIVREHGAEFLARCRVNRTQGRVLRDLVRCRTAMLGGHVEQCGHCPYQRVAYNSCRNRHCPKCQGSVAARWMQDRTEDLLNVPYFHVVLTVPQVVAELALQNPRVVYWILFRAAAQTLLNVAADPRHLGAKIGLLAVLHTWGQRLHHHPHVHCVVPGGGLSPDGTRWVFARKRFFLPVRVLSRVFRGRFLALLKKAYARQELEFHGRLAPLRQAGAWQHWLNVAARREWVVYAKQPFGGPAAVLQYLARYTHRVAISNRRLLALRDGQVTFRYRDSADGNQQRTMTLSAVEFLRRFLLHVLPRGFVRIRHFGLLANRQRQQALRRCRELLGPVRPEPGNALDHASESAVRHDGDAGSRLCPACQQGLLRVAQFPRGEFFPGTLLAQVPQVLIGCDSS